MVNKTTKPPQTLI